MTETALIPEVPKPPRKRLPFPMLLYRMISNPVESWSRDFYDEDIVVYRGAGTETVFVMSPELIDEILFTDTESYARVYSRVFGSGGSEGLIMAEGERWRWQRQLLAPLFRPSEVAAFVPIFLAAVEPFLQRWTDSPPGSLQNIHAAMTIATLQVLEDTVLGAGLSEAEHQRIAAAVVDFLRPLTWKAAYATLGLPRKTPHPHRAKRALAFRDLAAIAERAVGRRRQSGAEIDDVLGRLISGIDPDSGKPMSDRLIIDNLMTFIVAGHETTANALTWTLYLLALFPHWQERARKEVQRVAPDGVLGRRQIEELTLLDEILNESMRLYPPVANLIRKTSRPVTLGGEAIGEGATIVIPTYVLHRHRQVWNNPLRFDPSRFSPEQKAGRHRCAFIPFGAGPRTCIGATLSMIEGRTLLAAMLSRMRFDLPKGVKPYPFVRLAMRPKRGLKLNVTPL